MAIRERPALERALSRIRRALPLVLCCALGAVSRQAVAADSFLVIVNAANPAASLRAQDVSDFFLKKTSAWSDGTKAAPVDLDESEPARENFSSRIHHKSTAAVKAYWQKMIFSGREVPPPEKASPEEVVTFVRAHPGGIGYVPSGTALGAGVKVLTMKP